MKKFNAIIEEIKNTTAEIAAAEREEELLTDKYISVHELRARIEAKKAVSEELKAAGERKKDLQLKRKILQNNAKIALFNEAMPAALEVLKKYAGKPYGEKTRQKICDEVKTITNCRFYISNNFSSFAYDVYPVGLFDDYHITCGTQHIDGSKKDLLIDNKIQLVNFEEIALYYVNREYVENVPERIEELKKLHAEAAEKAKELEAICSKYNNLAVGTIPHIYRDKHISIMQV